MLVAICAILDTLHGYMVSRNNAKYTGVDVTTPSFSLQSMKRIICVCIRPAKQGVSTRVRCMYVIYVITFFVSQCDANRTISAGRILCRKQSDSVLQTEPNCKVNRYSRKLIINTS